MLNLERFEKGELEEAVAISCALAVYKRFKDFVENGEAKDAIKIMDSLREFVEQYDTLFIDEEEES